MSLDLFNKLVSADAPNRLLIEASLKPVQGSRFQPTGFPQLGAAVFDTKDGQCLLVESAQSMANRLEGTIWDKGANELIPAAKGLSYVMVKSAADDSYLTSTITEAHRLNSPYILEGEDKTFFNTFKAAVDCEEGEVNRNKLATALLKYDVNSLLHGIFLSKKELAGGRCRVERCLSSFVEASGIHLAASGGVKNDHVNPSGSAKDGFGNVPFSRDEYTADRITAYFNLDLKEIRSFNLGEKAVRLLVALALYKICALLDGDLRFRTACDLTVDKVSITSMTDAILPSVKEMEDKLSECIRDCASAGLFATANGITTVKYAKKASKKSEDSEAN